MARLEESKRNLLLWARWKQAGEDAADWEASELDAVISALPAVLQLTLREVYLHAGDIQAHARSLGCPEGTISRRLGRADRLLADQITSRRDQATVNGTK